MSVPGPPPYGDGPPSYGAPAPYGPPPEGEGAFGVPPGPRPRRRMHWQAPTSRDVLSAVIIGLALIVAGIPLGLLWGATTPKINVSEALGGSTGIISEATFNTQAGIDVHFAFLALIFGVVAGVLIGWRARRASWALPIGVAIGATAGSLVAAQIGHALESSSVLDQIPEKYRGSVGGILDFVLRSHGFHVVFPVAALLTYLIIVLLTTRSEPAELPAEPEPDRYWSVPR